MLHLGHILQPLTNYRATGSEPPVSAVVVDSRDAIPGSVFVALAGEQVDGHNYVQEAFGRGAIAALVQRPISGTHTTFDLRTGEVLTGFNTPICLVVENCEAAMQHAARAWRTRFPVRVVGITGSVGKTSTKEVVYGVLSQRFNTLKSPGNRNSILGLPPVLFELRPQHERAVFEMAMYTKGEIARLCEMAQPTIGVVTMVGPVHMERAGSLENIVAAKQELVEALPANGVAILNKDDERVMSMATHTKARVFTYGLDPTADLWADNISSMGLDGIRFTLHHGREALRLQLSLIGRHSVHTALRATAVGLVEGLSWDEIAAGLMAAPGQMRLVVVEGPHGCIILDDTYNASPDSVLAALNLLKDLDGRHIAVLGDMLELGQAEEASHRLVGRRAADIAQVLIAVGKRGRAIGEEALKVGMPQEHVVMVEDVLSAVPLLEELIQPYDVILVKGSLGMRMDRIVTGISKTKK